MQDVTDGAPGNPAANPSLLTLANRSTWRIQANRLLTATTIAAPVPSAGALQLTVASPTNLHGPDQTHTGDVLWIGGANPEVATIGPPGLNGSVVNLAAGLQFNHSVGDPVNSLPTIITDHEPRNVITDPAAYWRVVVGPEHEVPVVSPVHRAPIRLYEAILVVKVYDAGGSHAASEQVRDRLDYLLNLGDEGCNGNPSPLLGPSVRDWLTSLYMAPASEPHFDLSTLTLQTPITLHAQVERRFQ